MVYSADHRVKLPLLESFFSPLDNEYLSRRQLSGHFLARGLSPPFFSFSDRHLPCAFRIFPTCAHLSLTYSRSQGERVYTRKNHWTYQLILLKRPFHYFYRSFETFPIFTIRFDNIFPNQTMTPPLTMFRRNSQKRRLSTSSSMYPKRTWIPNIFCAIRLGTFSESVLSQYMW